ncbi:S24 family peptidase [Enterococcus plantarum]|nr:S24 family peptidase [Enterococcus plantarum]
MSGSLGNKEIMAENLNYYMKKNNVSRNKLSDDLNISYTTIRDWVKAKTYPRIDKIEILANYFNIDKSDLVEKSYKTELSIQPIFGKLNPDRQTKVYKYAKQQLDEQESLNSKIIPLVGKTAANPTVLEYGDVDIEQHSFSHVPEGADCAIYIQGDSMEPLIKDGSIVFYKRQEDVESGEIAVVEINGDGATCKRVIKDYENRQIILRSANDRYDDRILHDEKVRIIGKVIL